MINRLPLQSPGGSTNESLTSILNRETSSWWRARPGKPHREAGSREIRVSHLAKLGVRSTHHASRLTWSGAYEWVGKNCRPIRLFVLNSALPLAPSVDYRDAAMNA